MVISTKLIVILSTSVYGLIFTIIGFTTSFHLLGVPIFDPSFADLRLITTASDCFLTSEWSMISPSCDPWGREFNYPSLWVKLFAALNISEANTVFVGVVEILLLSSVFAYWIWRIPAFHKGKSAWIYYFFVLSFVISPPILLLMERGNVDTLIFVGLTFAAELLRRGFFLRVSFLILLLGALKLYPFAGGLAPFLATTSRRKRALITVMAFAGVLITFGEWRLIAERSITTWTSVSYGSSILPLRLFQLFAPPDSQIFSATVFATIGIALFFGFSAAISPLFTRQIKDIAFKIRLSNKFEDSFVLFSAIFLFSYLVGTSYDYRLVMTFPLFLIFFATCNSPRSQVGLVSMMFSILYGGELVSRFGYIGITLNLLSDAIIMLFSSLVLLLLLQLKFNKFRSLS